MLVRSKRKYFLRDILNLSQFTIDFPKTDVKFITLIGEYHNEKIECGSHPEEDIINIADYLKNISPEINKKVILEYDKFLCSSESIIECSLNIKYTLENIDFKKYKNIKKIAIDFRTQFLGLKNQYILYNNPELIIKYSTKDILNIYVDTFFLQITEKSKFLKGEKYNKFVNILFSDYLPRINSRFENLGRVISDKWSEMSEKEKNDNIISLKKLWSDLSDYYILREFFKDENIDEYIIIVGKNHYDNIFNYLKTLPNFTYILNKTATVNKSGKINCITTENILEYRKKEVEYELSKAY
jgi:hypothetical protein